MTFLEVLLEYKASAICVAVLVAIVTDIINMALVFSSKSAMSKQNYAFSSKNNLRVK